jgi:Asp-tRNA(Asn)/Glu-tRNA(Gln) amidotransferase A subunit family amidase
MAANGFVLQEASIAQLHAAIQSGETTCVQVVQQYIERARRYNGVSTQLLTRDGRDIDAPMPGVVRAQATLQFPRATLRADDFLPDLDQY